MKFCSVCNKTDKDTKIILHNGILYCRKHYLQMYRNGKISSINRLDGNEYVVCNSHAKIVLRDTYGAIKQETLIDISDIERCKLVKWYHRKNKKLDYTYGKVNTKTIMLHRYLLNAPDNLVVDHIDGNPMNNQKSNLRICSRQQNSMNMHKDKFIGVTYDKERNKWISQICVNYKTIHLGRYENFEDAVLVRKNAERKYFGQYSSQTKEAN